MCKNHNKVNGKDAVIMLTEARMDATVCSSRIKYLEGQVVSFMHWLDDQGADGKAIVLAIHRSTQRILEENTMDEFTWTTSREDSPSLSDTMSGKDDVDSRMDDEHHQHQGYWGMHHNIAYKAFLRTKGMESEDIFNRAKAKLDELEESFDSGKKRPLPYKQYQLGWKIKKHVDLHRFKLKSISYEQWAYLTNWVNCLLSIDKQFTCEMQNIGVSEFSQDPTLEDVAYEVEQVYYTMD